MKNNRVWLFRISILLTLGILLVWALRNAPLIEIWLTIKRLQPFQIGLLMVVNALLYILISLRWWIIVRAQAKQVPFWPLVLVRLAVFGVSYFTLGPQIGGEPLQVLALQRRYGLTYSRAAASVILDKLLEFLANFLMLALGMAAILQAGLVEEDGLRLTGSLVLLLGLIAWPSIHIILMYNRIYPLTIVLRFIPFLSQHSRPVRFLRASEWLAGIFCQRHPRALLGSLGISLLAGIGMLLDYLLMISFLGIRLPFWQAVAGWTAGWLSFLVPLPGGLGALEASQVMALGFFGVSAAVAISVTLLMRARDLLIGGLGLLLAGDGFSRVK